MCSYKSTRLPENRITKSVVNTLNSEGIPIRIPKTCDDIGIQMTGGQERRVSKLNKRIKILHLNQLINFHTQVKNFIKKEKKTFK